MPDVRSARRPLAVRLVIGLALLAPLASCSIAGVGVGRTEGPPPILGQMVLHPADLGQDWTVYAEGADSVASSQQGPCGAPQWHDDRGGYEVQMSYEKRADGHERGHAVSAVWLASSHAAAQSQLDYFNSSEYPTCLLSETTADVERSRSSDAGVDGGDVRRIPLDFPAVGTHFLVTVRWHERNGGNSYSDAVDVFHLYSGRTEAVLTFTRCTCEPFPTDVTLAAEKAAAAITPKSPTAPPAPAPGVTTPPQSPTSLPTLPLQPPTACPFMQSTDMVPIIGANRGPAYSQTGDGADECTWLSTSGGPSAVAQTGVTSDQYARRLEHTDEPITGIGNQARGNSAFPGQVLVRKGTRWVWIDVQGTPDDRADAVSLAKSALAEI